MRNSRYLFSKLDVMDAFGIDPESDYSKKPGVKARIHHIAKHVQLSFSDKYIATAHLVQTSRTLVHDPTHSISENHVRLWCKYLMDTIKSGVFLNIARKSAYAHTILLKWFKPAFEKVSSWVQTRNSHTPNSDSAVANYIHPEILFFYKACNMSQSTGGSDWTTRCLQTLDFLERICLQDKKCGCLCPDRMERCSRAFMAFRIWTKLLAHVSRNCHIMIGDDAVAQDFHRSENLRIANDPSTAELDSKKDQSYKETIQSAHTVWKQIRTELKNDRRIPVSCDKRYGYAVPECGKLRIMLHYIDRFERLRSIDYILRYTQRATRLRM